MERVLQGIRVLDFSRYISGPYCGMLLADMGAEVIKVERPGGEEDRMLGPFTPSGEAMPAINLARNKKGITLDLLSEKGKEILGELVKRADVVVENFSRGAKEAMGLSYESLREVNPSIILVTISGFGSTGPYSHRLGFDPLVQAMSGAMSYTGFPDGPPVRAAVPYVDFGTALHAALGTMFALYDREKTGKGQIVELALLDTAVCFVAAFGVVPEYKLLGKVRRQIGNHSFYAVADSFKAKDGWVFISAVTNSLWRRFLRAIGREELLDDDRFQDDNSRFENRELIRGFVSEWVAEKTVAQVIALLEEARVPCGPVNTVDKMVADPQVKARELIVDMEYPGVGQFPFSGFPIKLSETPARIETRAPMVGEHNEEVYCGLLGYSKEWVAKLRAEEVI